MLRFRKESRGRVGYFIRNGVCLCANFQGVGSGSLEFNGALVISDLE